jgi:hypothetical protein
MALKELLLAAILQWAPPWYPPGENPETVADYHARLETIAEAVALESTSVAAGRLDHRALAAATLTVWYGETRFSYEVHALGKSRWHQDWGKARCLGQIHVSGLVPQQEWEQMVGADLEATRRCARATMRVLAAQSRYCSVRGANQGSLARVFAAYGSGRGCRVTPQAKKRSRRWAVLMQRI